MRYISLSKHLIGDLEHLTYSNVVKCFIKSHLILRHLKFPRLAETQAWLCDRGVIVQCMSATMSEDQKM